MTINRKNRLLTLFWPIILSNDGMFLTWIDMRIHFNLYTFLTLQFILSNRALLLLSILIKKCRYVSYCSA